MTTPKMTSTPLLFLLLIAPAQSILQTATIDILLPGVPTPLTLLASQASFGSPLVSYTDGHHHSSSSSRPAGVGLIPTSPPDDDPYLCNESYGWTTYKNSDSSSSTTTTYNNAAILVPRGQCSFERKALSAQRLGASAILIYGSLSSRYSLNVTNTTNDNDGSSNNDAYTRNDYTMNDVIWPVEKQDYDCDHGQAFIPENVVQNQLDFVSSPGGYNVNNDEYLIGNSENNLCVKYGDGGSSSSSFISSCESQRCLVTGKNVTSDEGSDGDYLKYQACCAWDFAIWLYADTSLSVEEQKEVTIPAVYLTMQQATELLDLVNGVSWNNGDNNNNGNGDPIVISMYARDRPSVNSSAYIIWALGVFVAWMASFYSSSDYRNYANAILKKRQLVARAGRVAAVAVASARGQEGEERAMERPPSTPERRDGTPRSRSQSRERSETNATAAASPPSEDGERTIYRGGDDASAAAITNRSSVQPLHIHQEEESLELDASHAVGFIVMASTSLLVLFFFKIFNVVKVFYAFGCSGAFAQVVIYPLLIRLFRKLRWKSPMRPMECLSEENATRASLNGGCKGKILMCLYSCFGPITSLDIMANTIAYAVGGTWLYIAFTVIHPESHLFYWIVQDVFGACMCITFLGTIKINAIRVAAILLTVAFFYDIFFVFVTPLLTKHGESIMVNVATSGGPPKADPSWCEKYPSSADCKGGEPLPMLFAIPRIGDYQGGSSMLGLGDIVLPGLLLSFASRFDEAKRLMGLVSGGSGRVRNGGGTPNKSSWSFCCGCGQGGYFGPVVVAYAVGLAMANAAVYLMQMGQPALLYLVPCCLGTFVFMARRNGELNDIWDNPRAIRAADALLFGGRIEEDEDDVRTSSLLMNEGAEMT